MSIDHVCAVIVSYHPDTKVFENVLAARTQLQSILVVDNGSTEEELIGLRTACSQLDVNLIENGVNLGIAVALNQGVAWAIARGFELVMLFDQDSSVTEGFVTTMLRCFVERSKQNLAILVPRYVDRRFGMVLASPIRGDVLEAATTSGSLMPVRVFAEAGFFAEELFIDGVDYEYSLRVRGRGWIIAECAEAMLLHAPGTPTYHSLLGLKRFQTANYSPVRRYFQERNKVWVVRRYWRQFLPFCLRQFAISIKDLIKIVLIEEDKAAKVSHFFRGLSDGLRQRMGAFPVRG